MALIEVFHVVATECLIDPNNSDDQRDTGSGGDIPQGSLVRVQGNDALIEMAQDTGELPLGIAADSKSAGITSYTPESGSALSSNPKTSLTGALVVGSAAAYPTTGVLARRFTQNRISDNYNEVLASGKMTVYHSGGEFWTDQYVLTTDNGITSVFDAGVALYPGTSAANNGKFSDQAPAALPHLYFVGVVMTSPLQYPIGVPGVTTDFTQLPEGGNSLSFGTMLHVALRI